MTTRSGPKPERSRSAPAPDPQAKAKAKAKKGRERTCVASRETLSEAELIRFVASPDQTLTPDLAAKLPGRGAWLRSDRASLAKAVKRKCFERELGVRAPEEAEIAAQIEDLLKRRIHTYLGMARRAGEAASGFDQVATLVKSDPAKAAVVLEASDGAEDGRGKILGALSRSGAKSLVVGVFNSDELGLAFGRSRVIHAVLTSGAVAPSVISEAARLEGFRPLTPPEWR